MTPRTLRLKVNRDDSPGTRFEAIAAWKGNPLNIAVGVFDEDGVNALSGVSSLKFEVRDSESATSNLAAQTIAAASFSTLTQAEWDAESDQHVTFEFTGAEMNIALTASPAPREMFAFVSAVLSGGEIITLAAGKFTLHLSPNTDAGDPDTNPESAISATEADARYLRWYSAVTDLTGGSANDLDAIATTSLSVGALACFALSGVFQIWQLQAVSTAENAAGGIVRPDDFHATTNIKTWIKIG